MLDNRLDFISKIDGPYLAAMRAVREMFIELDNELKSFALFEAPGDNIQAAMRCISLARNNLETSLQYSIKSLCLIGEIKE